MSSDPSRNRSHRRAGTLYCSSCGSELEPTMNYCPNCGASNGYSTNNSDSRFASPSESTVRPRREASGETARTTDRDVLEYRIATAAQDGWKLEHDFGDHAVMVRRTVGSLRNHLIIALVTVWFTMGFGNALYGAYCYFGDAERIVLRADHTEGDEATDETSGHRLGRATAAVCWLTATIIAAIGLQLGTALGLVLFALAFTFAVMGASALPSVHRRLEARHSVTANGRVRSVDERTVVAYDRPCGACANPVGRGLERIYRKEFCVLGVPLTASEGRNYYCRECANAEVAAGTRGQQTAESSTGPAMDRSPEPSERDRDPESERT